MTIPYANLQVKYEELANQFITDVNNTSVTFVYPNYNLTPTGIVERPFNEDMFGGRVNLKDLMGHSNEAGVNYTQGSNETTVKARIYWKNVVADKDLKVINIKDNKNICKMNCYAEYKNMILKCSHAVINGYKCKLIQEPIPYGLFSKIYLISFWEIMDE